MLGTYAAGAASLPLIMNAKLIVTDVWGPYASSGLLTEAEGVLGEMEAAGVTPNGVTYNAIIACCVRLGRAAQATSLLEHPLDFTFHDDPAESPSIPF